MVRNFVVSIFSKKEKIITSDDENHDKGRSSSQEEGIRSASEIVSDRLQRFHKEMNGTIPYDVSFCNVRKFREEDINILKLIGRGAFSEVNQAYHTNSDEIYAIKSLKQRLLSNQHHVPSEILADLALETAILATLCHENIITLRGIKDGDIIQSLEKNDFFIVLDLLTETLHDRLIKWKGRHQRCHYKTKLFNITRVPNEAEVIRRLEDIAIGIVNGMEYMHSKRIIYRDLKPMNIGFDELHDQVKIFDLGLSREYCKNKHQQIHSALSSVQPRLMTIGVGTPRYMAPEIAMHETSYGFPVDVYSFGILLWQLLTNRTPFNNISSPIQFVTIVSKKGRRPSLLYVKCRELKILIKACWSASPDNRPTFSSIKESLKSIINFQYSDEQLRSS